MKKRRWARALLVTALMSRATTRLWSIASTKARWCAPTPQTCSNELRSYLYANG